MYEKGQKFEVLRTAELVWWEPIAPYAQRGASRRLLPGDVVECQGEGYSGGSDGINLPMFRLVGPGGTYGSPAAEFSPTSWGSPLEGYLLPLKLATDPDLSPGDKVYVGNAVGVMEQCARCQGYGSSFSDDVDGPCSRCGGTGLVKA